MVLVPEEPSLADVIAEQRELQSRLRAVVETKDAENAMLRRELDAERELRRRLELRLAELERRLSMDSSDSGTPTSKERIGAKEARRARQQSERERSKDRKRTGSQVIRGKGCGGTRTPVRGRPRIRPLNAAAARRPWTALSLRSRGGRRSSTWRSSGR